MSLLQQNISLKEINTFGIDVSAAWFGEFSTQAELIALLEDARAKSLPFKILGGGSNILFTKNFEGALLKNNMQGMHLISETDDEAIVSAKGGSNWHAFVLWSIEQGYQGLENLSLIPGTVGAAPIQNIGAYGVEIRDFFYQLTAVDSTDLSTHTFSSADCNFAYRDSIFKSKWPSRYVICEVQFKLNKLARFNTSYGAISDMLQEQGVTELSARAISNAVIAIRQSKLPDPAKIGNAGSFFKNPEIEEAQYETLIKSFPNMPAYNAKKGFKKVPAGWLIEQCGLKGYTADKVGVHKQQALVLVNYGGANGSDVYNLSAQIIDAVQKKYNITLEREVNVW
ncbi:MAG: hypothetical protein RL660_2191 [Bacteroidota bacterium]|jgi:UDP-N-acetylmuramate dehydrogenase